MLTERSRIDNSHNLADSLLSQAYETRDHFARQRASLSSVQRRLAQTASYIPGLNTIIAKVNTRKKRDSLILATLITGDTFLALYMVSNTSLHNNTYYLLVFLYTKHIHFKLFTKTTCIPKN